MTSFLYRAKMAVVHAVNRCRGYPVRGGQLTLPSSAARMAELARVAGEAARRSERPLFLEIGSLLGDSALVLAEAVAERGGQVLCCDLWDWPGALDRFARRTAARKNEITMLRGDVRRTLDRLIPASFDLVYIDADHTYPNVLLDLQAAQRLVKPGGIICGDDLELQIPRIPEAIARRHRHTDSMEGILGHPYHPGVTAAVAEVFGPVDEACGFWWRAA